MDFVAVKIVLKLKILKFLKGFLVKQSLYPFTLKSTLLLRSKNPALCFPFHPKKGKDAFL